MVMMTQPTSTAEASFAAEVQILLSLDFGLDDVAIDEDLLESGALDSLAIVELVTALEDSFEIAVPDDEMTAANFSTIASIAALAARLRQ